MNIDSLKWFERPETNRCGVYMLMLKGVPQYIGKSVDVDMRLADHRRVGKLKWDSSLFTCVPYELLDEVERALLLAYVPPKNAIFPATDKGVELNRKFKHRRKTPQTFREKCLAQSNSPPP